MNEAFSISFSPLAGTAENRWLRLVQVGADDDIVTMDEAAGLIDALYKISPCDTGTGGSGGGENAPEEPTEEEFDALSAEALGELCAGQDHWDVQVDLLRSHPNPAAWRVQAGDAEHVSTEIVVETRTETVVLDGANHHDLERPYHASLRVVGAEVADVRGSTVNFARPVTGRVRLTYTTRFERLTIRVPATPGPHGQAVAEPAAVVAFWDGRAAQLDLKQPEPDDGVSAAELERLCRGKGKDKDRPAGGCWERLAHHSLCACSGRPAPDSEWEETVGADCPENVRPGSYLGTRRVLDGYVGCEGEVEDLHDPEHYRAVCCHYPPPMVVLPRCRETRAVYRGGAPIEGGEDSWRERYGPDVTFTAVSPEDGICGEEITRWREERQNCCDDIIPLSPSPNNPESFCAGETHWIGVRDGKPGDLRWRLGGGLVFEDDGTTYRITPSRSLRITTRADVCPRPTVSVDDGCEPVTMVFPCDDAEANAPTLPAEPLYVAPDTEFYLSVSGGVPGYMWMAGGGLRVLGYSPDGATIYLRTGARDEWCRETVAVTDQCGRRAECDVYNGETGRWREVPQGEFDPCSPPGAPFPTDHSSLTPSPNRNTLPSGGYYAYVIHGSNQGYEPGRGTRCGRQPSTIPCEPGNLVSDTWYIERQCPPPTWTRLSETCYAQFPQSETGGYTYSRQYAQYASRLYQWIC